MLKQPRITYLHKLKIILFTLHLVILTRASGSAQPGIFRPSLSLLLLLKIMFINLFFYCFGLVYCMAESQIMFDWKYFWSFTISEVLVLYISNSSLTFNVRIFGINSNISMFSCIDLAFSS